MGSSPGGEPDDRTPGARRHTVTVLAVVLAGAGALVATVWGVDRLAERAYGMSRPRLETLIGRGVGHPVRLGPYRGLRPWGLAIGPTRVLAGPADASTAAVAGLDVRLDPLASLAQGAAVLDLRLAEADLRLRRNAAGQFWVFGADTGGRSPRLSLRVTLEDTARVRLEPAGLKRAGLKLEVKGGGRLNLALHQSRFEWNATLVQTGGGKLGLQGHVHRDPSERHGLRELSLVVRPNSFRLTQLVDLFRLSPVVRGKRLSGTVSGSWKVSHYPGRQDSCDGYGNVADLSMNLSALPAPISFDLLSLSCKDDQLTVGRKPWKMANWNGYFGGELKLSPAFVKEIANRFNEQQDRQRVSVGKSLVFDLTAVDPRRGDRLALYLRGPWRQPRLKLEGRIPLGRGTPASPEPLRLEADLALDWRRDLTVGLNRLRLRTGRSELVARGALWPRLQVRSDSLRLDPSLWTASGGVASALLGRGDPLLGRLSSGGTLLAPDLSLSLRRGNRPLLELAATGRAAPGATGPLGRLDLRLAAPAGISLEGTPVLGAATARLRWSDATLRLESLRTPELEASGSLPLRWQARRGLVAGDLGLSFRLQPYGLGRIGPLLGVTLRGDLAASGRLSGPLGGLRPDLALTLSNPGSGPIQLTETWTGRLGPGAAGGRELRMTSRSPAPPGSLEARLDAAWLPRQLSLRRREGTLAFEGTARRYQWRARGFPLDGLGLALGAPARYRALQGDLSGRGWLDLQPLAMQGSVEIERPVLLGVRGQGLVASGRFAGGGFQLEGSLRPLQGGTVQVTASGRRGGALTSQLEGRDLPLELFRQLAEATGQWRGSPALPRGRASDLGTLMIDTLGRTVDAQLEALRAAHERVNQFRVAAAATPGARLEDLRGRIDLDLTLRGASLAALQANLAAKGHLWLRGEDQDEALRLDPFIVRLDGPLSGGRGRFSLENLPLALLALLTPVPNGLRGGLDLAGRYQLGPSGAGGRPRGGRSGSAPAFETSLSLRQASLNGTPLTMEQAQVRLEGDLLALEASLRSGGASGSVDLSGEIPLDPTRDGLKLRLSSRGDGLKFVTALVPRGLEWRQGSADLELLIRGSLRSPVANGFLRFRDGELLLAGQQVRQLNATILFDFQELLVQEFTARMGETGRLNASGGLGLFQPTPQSRALSLEVSQARITVPRLNALADGTLELQGSLLRPVLTGQLRISKGTINGQPGSLAVADANGAPRPVQVRQLAEESWNFQQPLVLLGPGVESSAGVALRQGVPNFAYLRLQDLRLSLGPDLQVVVPAVANFRTGGALTLNGPIDPSLRASGVVRLLSGRLSLFTTTFTLDPDAPNVAVFTPSLGLVPYVDIALRTRVSDSLGTGLRAGPVDEFDLRGGYTPLDQLNLIKVVVTVSGPADRIAESIRITSTPPLPQDRLVALIGGNSLAGLSGGNATTALATVFGQSLLSPLLSTLSDAFGQRVSFALYPTFFSPTVSGSSETITRRIPPQLVLGSEIGLDITERFNFSVLAAPNRSDIPPQLTLRYQASETLGLQGSFDTEGRWQTQLQVFFRF